MRCPVEDDRGRECGLVFLLREGVPEGVAEVDDSGVLVSVLAVVAKLVLIMAAVVEVVASTFGGC